MVLALAVVLLLIACNALYVAAEFAAVGVRRSRLRRLAEDGNALAARVLPIVEDARLLDRYIAVSQVGITLSSLVLGAFGQAALGPRLSPLLIEWAGMETAAAQSAAAVTLLLVLTAVQMVLGELVPKSIALQYPTQTALYTVIPMQWSLGALRWATAALNGSGTLLLRVLRVPLVAHRHVHSPEEIELLIAESRDGGLLEPVEQVRLHRALRLGLKTAKELMVPRERLAAVEASVSFEDLLREAMTSPYTRLPVYRGTLDRIVGILHTRDVVERYIRGGAVDERPLWRPVVEVPDAMPADQVLSLLRAHRRHQAIVRDDGGRVAGLITLEDVLTELLGTVSDEFKTTATPPEPRPGEGSRR
jgi:putative hemolysin